MIESRRFFPNQGHLEEYILAGLMFLGEDSVDVETLKSRIKSQAQLEAAFLGLYQEMGTKAVVASLIPYDIEGLGKEVERAVTAAQLVKIGEDIQSIFAMVERAVQHSQTINEFTAQLKVFVTVSEVDLVISDQVKEYLVKISHDYSLIETTFINNQPQLLNQLQRTLLALKEKAATFLSDQSE